MTSRDTSRAAREAQIAALRSLGGAGRLELAFAMSEEARAISLAGIRARNPQLSEAEARAQLLRRILGPELYAAVYESSRSEP